MRSEDPESRGTFLKFVLSLNGFTFNKLPRRNQRGIGMVIKYFRPKGRRIKPQEIIKTEPAHFPEADQ